MADCTRAPMAAPSGSHHWSVSLASSRGRRPRWLAENGRFTSDPARALRLVSAEVAAQRLQQYLRIHGKEPSLMERLMLVPSPPLIPAARGGETLAA